MQNKNDNTLELISDFNYIFKELHSNYIKWAANFDVGFVELVILINIRDNDGYFYKKNVADKYYIANQSINNVVRRLVNLNYLSVDYEKTDGHDRVYALTNKGQEYVSDIYHVLNRIEIETFEKFGKDNLIQILKLMGQLNNSLVATVNDVVEDTLKDINNR